MLQSLLTTLVRKKGENEQKKERKEFREKEILGLLLEGK